MFKVICKESCIGDNDFIFQKDHLYTCVEDKGIVKIVEDENVPASRTIFYKKEYESFFKPVR